MIYDMIMIMMMYVSNYDKYDDACSNDYKYDDDYE